MRENNSIPEYRDAGFKTALTTEPLTWVLDLESSSEVAMKTHEYLTERSTQTHTSAPAKTASTPLIKSGDSNRQLYLSLTSKDRLTNTL